MKSMVDMSKIFSLGHFETRGISPKEMFDTISKDRKRVGYWFENIALSAQIEATSGVKFSLVIVGGQPNIKQESRLCDVIKSVCGRHIRRPTIEMGYYLWEFMCSLRTQDRRINGFDRLVICHEPIVLKGGVCPRIMSIDKDLVARGEIGGPGHCFGKDTGFVFQTSG